VGVWQTQYGTANQTVLIDGNGGQVMLTPLADGSGASVFLVTSASDLAISASPSDVLPLRKGFSKTPLSKRSGDACRPHTDSGCCRPRSGARHRQKQPPPGSVPTGACRWMV
jgi:hypothetical protein